MDLVGLLSLYLRHLAIFWALFHFAIRLDAQAEALGSGSSPTKPNGAMKSLPLSHLREKPCEVSLNLSTGHSKGVARRMTPVEACPTDFPSMGEDVAGVKLATTPAIF